MGKKTWYDDRTQIMLSDTNLSSNAPGSGFPTCRFS